MTTAVGTKKAQIESEIEIKQKGSRLWIDPLHLPTRLAQRVREGQHPSSRWLRKTDADSQTRYLKLADVALKENGSGEPPITI